MCIILYVYILYKHACIICIILCVYIYSHIYTCICIHALIIIIHIRVFFWGGAGGGAEIDHD